MTSLEAKLRCDCIHPKLNHCESCTVMSIEARGSVWWRAMINTESCDSLPWKTLTILFHDECWGGSGNWTDSRVGKTFNGLRKTKSHGITINVVHCQECFSCIHKLTLKASGVWYEIIHTRCTRQVYETFQSSFAIDAGLEWTLFTSVFNPKELSMCSQQKKRQGWSL